MGDVGRIGLAVAGTAVGTYFGQPGLGFAAGSFLGNFFFGAGGKDQIVEGPRQQNLQVQTSRYGELIPILYGAMRPGGQVVWAESIREHVNEETEEQGKGGGGPEVTTRTYFYTGTWASLFCEGPIQGYARVWFDVKLMFDTRSIATSATRENSRKFQADHMRFYFGSEGQSPDPAIEAAEGVGNVPAMLGQAYIVFDTVLLADFGNRIPSVSAEPFTVGNGDVDIFDFAATITGGPAGDTNMSVYDRVRDYYITFSPRSGVGGSGSACAIFDTDTRTYKAIIEKIGSTQNRGNGCIYTSIGGTEPDRLVYAFKNFFNVFDLDGDFSSSLSFHAITDPHAFWEEYLSFICFTRGTTGSSKYAWNKAGGAVVFQSVPTAPVEFLQNHIGVPGAGYGIQAYRNTSTGKILFGRHSPDSFGGVVGTIHDSGLLFSEWVLKCLTWDPGRNFVWALFGELPGADHWLYKIDTDGQMIGTPRNLGDLGSVSGVSGNHGMDLDPNGDIIAIHLGTDTMYFYRIAKDSLRGIDVSGTNNDMVRYNFLKCEAYEWRPDVSSVPYTYVIELDCKDPGCETLEDVAKDIGLRCGLGVDDQDAGQLVGDVCGFLVGQQTGRGAIENLEKAHHFDGVSSEGKIKYVPRGTLSGVTIDTDQMVVEAGAAPLEITRMQELEIPRRVSATYPQKDKNYQQGEQHAQRIITASVAESTLELRLAMSDIEASKSCDVGLFAAWTERTSFKFSLPIEYLYLEPSDVITLTDLDSGLSFRVRLTSMVLEYYIVLRCEAVEENIALYTSNAAGAGGPADFSRVGAPGVTVLELLDLPMLSDNHNDPRLHFALGGVSNDWFGARLYRSVDAGVSYSAIASAAVSANIGEAATALAAGNATTWDFANTVDVVLENENATLSSLSELATLNGGNGAALVKSDGSIEVFQFADAALIAPKTYRLSKLLRGRRGSEYAIAGHAIGDRFVMLSGSGLRTWQTTVSDINSPRSFKGVSVGTDIADVTGEDYTYTGVNLKPLSPVFIAGTWSGVDVTISWFRRSRFTGQMLQTPILGEDSEQYQIDIMSGPTVLNTYTTTSPSLLYTSTQQAADGLTPGDAVEINIYQISAVVGRGFPENATTTATTATVLASEAGEFLTDEDGNQLIED